MRLHSALIAVLTHLVGKLKGVALRNSQVCAEITGARNSQVCCGSHRCARNSQVCCGTHRCARKSQVCEELTGMRGSHRYARARVWGGLRACAWYEWVRRLKPRGITDCAIGLAYTIF